jgi:hypothetical protein
VREKKKKRKEKNQGKKKKGKKKKKLREVRRKPTMLGLGEIKEERWVW